MTKHRSRPDWRRCSRKRLKPMRGLGEIAIVLVEQYFDFARELGDRFAVMDRGAVVYSCTKADMDEAALRRAISL